MQKIKKGQKRFLNGVLWEVTKLKPLMIRVWSWWNDHWDKPFLVPSSRKEFLSFGQEWKEKIEEVLK